MQLKQIRDPQQKLQFLQQRQAQLQQVGIPTGDTEEAMQLIQQGRFDELEEVTDQAIALGVQMAGGGKASSRAFAPDTVRKVVGQDEEGNDVFGLFSRQLVFDPATNTSKAVETPIEGDLVTSTGETVSQKQAREIELERGKAEAKAVGKAEGEVAKTEDVAASKAAITTAVKLAEKAAAAKGETLTDLSRSKAALPGLRSTVEQLKQLAPIATSTLGGRIFDVAVKEAGFGSTEGADARAKFIAIVNNQVLPLLKQTFGSAFTEKEGEALKATMGDPNSSPDQKIEQLNAFIDQKVRTIQSQERELGEEVTATEELTTGKPLFSSVLNRNITEADITETLNSPQGQGMTRAQLLQQLQVQ
jgi:hypothetical protein